MRTKKGKSFKISFRGSHILQDQFFLNENFSTTFFDNVVQTVVDFEALKKVHDFIFYFSVTYLLIEWSFHLIQKCLAQI